MKTNAIHQALTVIVAVTVANVAYGQIQGPSTGSMPYVLPLQAGTETISILTTDNTGANPDDTVPKVGGGTYGFDGIPDGIGAYDNGDGTFTVLVNHEVPSSLGVARAHGGVGAYVSELVINKNTLAVVSGQDLIQTVFSWNSATQSTGPAITNAVFFRFCSADLAEPTAFFNASTGLGSTARILLNGEEDSTHGWALAHVATGASKGSTYILGKFNLTTNGSGLTGVGDWENLLANPFPQDKTIVIGNNDGGTGIMANALSVYVGTKTNTGSEADKAGLTNGTMKFVAVTGNPVEISNTTTRTTAITNGTRFTLSGTSSTTFSRPEDGAWNPLNLKEYYFVTTDQLDQVSDGLGTQIGQTRLWRLTFDDLTNPDAGGKIDLLIDGQTVAGLKVNMFDNITVSKKTGRILLQEDVGNAIHNGKMWEYDPATFTGTTNSGGLILITKHDPTRFGDRVNGMSTPATTPYNQDEETSGVLDITDIMTGSTRNQGYSAEAWYISSDQAHYTSAITASQVEGGQLFLIHQLNTPVARSGFVRDRRTSAYAQQATVSNVTPGPLAGPFNVVLDGLSANATLTNASGTTNGSPYITLPGTAGGVGAGASANVTLQFSNPSNAAITYSNRVLDVIPALAPKPTAEREE
jgi:hypothetical protein